MKLLYCFIFLACVPLAAAVDLSAQVPAQKIATEEDIKRDLQLVPCKSSERFAAVEKLFRSMGAADTDISVLEKKGTKNLVVTKKGAGNEMVIVGAHFDKVGDGCGALDNWTGIVAIANLYGTLRNAPLAKTFKFVAFDKEESGLLGSKAFVGEIRKEERDLYCAMVNLDSFGLAQPQVMGNTSNSKLTSAAQTLWTRMKLKLSSASIAGAGADSSSFLDAGIPAITFHGLTNDWSKFLHTQNDKLSNVNSESVFLGYRFVLPFLIEIDNAGCGDFRKKVIR